MSEVVPAVDVRAMAVRRGRRQVLGDVSFALGRGITAVVGRNGSGKSSLLRVLATVDRAAGGRMEVMGRGVDDLRSLRRVRASIGYLPQAWDLPAGTRVIDAVRHGAWLHRVAEPEEAVERVLEELDLLDVRSTPLAKLSGGTHRRVAIAQAVLHRPPVLLLDEPTAGLDVDQRARFWSWLADRAADAAVLVVTHDQEEVAAQAHRALVVADGSVASVEDPSPGAIADAVRWER